MAPPALPGTLARFDVARYLWAEIGSTVSGLTLYAGTEFVVVSVVEGPNPYYPFDDDRTWWYFLLTQHGDVGWTYEPPTMTPVISVGNQPSDEVG